MGMARTWPPWWITYMLACNHIQIEKGYLQTITHSRNIKLSNNITFTWYSRNYIRQEGTIYDIHDHKTTLTYNWVHWHFVNILATQLYEPATNIDANCRRWVSKAFWSKCAQWIYCRISVKKLNVRVWITIMIVMLFIWACAPTTSNELICG